MNEADQININGVGSEQTSIQRVRVYATLVFLAALVVRLAYLMGLEASPYYDVGYMRGADPYNFFVWAQKIVSGRPFDAGVPLTDADGIYYQSPLYAYFLAAVFKLTGGPNLLIPRFAQLFVGALTALITFALGRRIMGGRAGLWAGLLCAGYGPLIFYEGAFLRDGLATFLNAAFLLALVAARARPGFGRGAWLGGLWALAIMCKPNAMIMAPVIAWSVWTAEESSDRSKLRRLLAGMAIAGVLAFSPVVARNVAEGVPPLALTRSGPLEFIAGNRPLAPPSGLLVDGQVMELTRKSFGSTFAAILSVLELHRERPLALVTRQFHKALIFMNGYETPNNLNYYVERRYVGFMRGPWLTWTGLAALAALGLVARRSRWRECVELYGYLALMSAGTIAFFVIGRFRAPLAPAMCVFAGAGVAWLIERLVARDWRSAGAGLAAVVVIAAVLWPRPGDSLRTNDYHNVVRYHMLKNEPKRARELVESGTARARELVAERGGALEHHRMASLLYLGGADLAEVESELSRARAAGPPAWLAPWIESLEGSCRMRRQSGDQKPGGFRF